MEGSQALLDERLAGGGSNLLMSGTNMLSSAGEKQYGYATLGLALSGMTATVFSFLYLF